MEGLSRFREERGLGPGERYATLIPPAPTKVPEAAQPTAKSDDPESAPYQTLEDRVLQLERENDWAGARRYAEKALARFPQQPYAHSLLGNIDTHSLKYDQAIVDLKEELAAHPNDRSEIVAMLAMVYMVQKRYPEAIALLKSYTSRKELWLQQELIYMQSLNSDYDGALQSTRDALVSNPDNKQLQTQEAGFLKDLQRNDEAVTAAKHALENNNDPSQLNGNAYLLAELNRDLPLAESSSRRSIELFDQRMSTGGVEEANSRAFANAAGETAAWDTLGDILLLEQKPASGEPYLAASWFDNPDPAIGNHLAEAYAQLGRKEEARRIDTLALSLLQTSFNKTDRAALEAREDRLGKEGVKLPHGEAQTLQEQRTFHLKNPAALQGSGTVRAQLGPSGILSSILVTGDDSLKPLLAALLHLKIPAAVPPESTAHVLRDAVLFCGKGAGDCEFVFLERSGIAQESSPK